MDDRVMADCKRFGKILRWFSALFASEMNNVLGRGKVNLPQFNAVSAIYDAGSMTMGELGRSLGVTMGAATNIVDKLVKAGLVTRDRDAKDRRIVNVKLTPSGTRGVEEVRTSVAQVMSGIMVQVDGKTREEFLGTCEHLLALAEERKSASGT